MSHSVSRGGRARAVSSRWRASGPITRGDRRRPDGDPGDAPRRTAEPSAGSCDGTEARGQRGWDGPCSPGRRFLARPAPRIVEARARRIGVIETGASLVTPSMRSSNRLTALIAVPLGFRSTAVSAVSVDCAWSRWTAPGRCPRRRRPVDRRESTGCVRALPGRSRWPATAAARGRRQGARARRTAGPPPCGRPPPYSAAAPSSARRSAELPSRAFCVAGCGVGSPAHGCGEPPVTSRQFGRAGLRRERRIPGR